MQTGRPGFSASKSWYYFDDSFICLGAGISASGSNQAAFTSVNECRLQGPVVSAADRAQPRPLAPGGEHTLPMVRRIAHDGITYHFVQPSRLMVKVGAPQEKGVPEVPAPLSDLLCG